MEIERMLKLAGVTTLTEAKHKDVTIKGVDKDEFEDSMEFEDAYQNLVMATKVITDITRSKAMRNWIRHSKDILYSFDENTFKNFENATYDLQNTLHTFYEALDKASEGGD